MTAAGNTTTWTFNFGQRVRALSGESGEVIGRSERLNLEGATHRAYRIEYLDPKWGERTAHWFPEVRLRSE